MSTINDFLFVQNTFAKDSEEKRRSQALSVFWSHLWALVGLNIFGIIFVFQRKIGSFLLLLCVIAVLLLVRYMQRKGQIRIASFLLIAGLWIAYMTVIVFTGTIRTSIIVMPFAIIPMTIILLGLRAGLLNAGLTLLGTFIITMIELSGNWLPSFFPAAPLQNWFHLITAYAVLIIPLYQVWTENQQASKAVEAEKEFTDHALNSLRDLLLVFDPMTRESIRWNTAVNDFTGLSDPEIETLKVPDGFISKTEKANVENAIQRVIEDDFICVELQLLSKDGEENPVEFSGTTIRNDLGQVEYIISVGRDISDRKKTEIALLKSEQKHRLLFESANDGILIIKDGYFVDCNKRILEMFLADPKDILGKKPRELSPTFQADGKPTVIMEQEMLKAALLGERQFFEWRHVRTDQTEFDVEVSLNLLELENENLIQAIVRDITDRKQSERKLAEAYDTTLEGWAKALELRDKETEDHSRRVVELTLKLAKEMGIDEDALTHIRRGAILHDIGKMGIPDQILLKPGKLTVDERSIVELHPVYSFELLSQIPYLKKATDIPYCHHERWDGSGYPRGLKGDEIPLTARIFSVIDVWDALLSDRPYSKAWRRDEVLEHIKNESGRHFDPEVVKVFLQLVEKGVV